MAVEANRPGFKSWFYRVTLGELLELLVLQFPHL